MKPGIHTIGAAEYHADPCKTPSLSASIASQLVNRSPLHAWNAHPRLNPYFERVEKDAYDFGTITHALVLEGDDSRVHIIDAKDFRTNAAQEARDGARREGMIPILKKDWDRIRRVVESVQLNLRLFDCEPMLLAKGKPEQMVVWKEKNGIWCRALIDWLQDDFLAIDDLKTTSRSADPRLWARQTLWSIGADIQVAFNRRGIKAVTGVEPTFRYVLVETTPPYAVAAVTLSASALDMGERKVEHAIAQWGECLSTGVWPSYSQTVHVAETPPWEELRWAEQELEYEVST